MANPPHTDPVAEWNRLKAEATRHCSTPLQRQQAMSRLVQLNPGLHRRYLAAVNGGAAPYTG